MICSSLHASMLTLCASARHSGMTSSTRAGEQGHAEPEATDAVAVEEEPSEVRLPSSTWLGHQLPAQRLTPSRPADCYKCHQAGHWAAECPNEGGAAGGGVRGGYVSNARGGSSARGGSTRGRGRGASSTRGRAIAKRAATPRAQKEVKPKVERAVKPLTVKKETKPKVKAEPKPRVKAER